MIKTYARYLREAGMLSQNGRGTSAARATPLDAARLMIAVILRPKAKDVVEYVSDFGGLPCLQVEDLGLEDGFPIHERFFLEGHDFEEMLAGLIKALGEENFIKFMNSNVWDMGPVSVQPAILVTVREYHFDCSVACFGHRYTYSSLHDCFKKTREEVIKDLEETEPDFYEWPEDWRERHIQSTIDSSHYDFHRKYQPKIGRGVRTTHVISGVELAPLGQVVADLFEPGSDHLLEDKEWAQSLNEEATGPSNDSNHEDESNADN